MLESEHRSARAEAEELSTNRLQRGLDYEIALETLRREKVPTRQVDGLTSELRDCTTRRGADDRATLQSTSTLKDLLKDAQAGWQKGATDPRTITAGNETLRSELVCSVGSRSLALEPERAALASAQAQLALEQPRSPSWELRFQS